MPHPEYIDRKKENGRKKEDRLISLHFGVNKHKHFGVYKYKKK